MTTGKSFEKPVLKTLEFVSSDQAYEMIERDVYWPKWEHPWWAILALAETGNLSQVPQELMMEFLNCADRQYIHVFPVKPEDADEDVNGYTEVMCFCFLGSLLKVASLMELDLFAYMPWAKDWFTRYQLPDGGYNCDETAYLGSGKSSLISTVPMLEGMIQYQRFMADETLFEQQAKKAFDYLIKHNVFMSSSGKEIPGVEWDKLLFPRFYEFDFLRSLEVVLDYGIFKNIPIPEKAINKAVKLLEQKIADKVFYSEKQWLREEKTVTYTSEAPILFRDRAKVPVFLNIINAREENPFVEELLEKSKAKLEEAKAKELIK
jgi:hypothetical protein